MHTATQRSADTDQSHASLTSPARQRAWRLAASTSAIMDANEALEALSNLLTALSESPYDLSLHAQHIRLADASGDAEQAVAAREMMTAYWPAGDEVWLPLLRAKQQSVNLETAEGIPDVLALYSVAEDDYFCTSGPFG